MRVQTFQKPFIVTVMSTKGGVTKSTNVANISAFCADHGLNVLMIDTDTQPTLSSYYHIKQQAPYGLYELVMRVNDHAKMRQADAVRSSKSDPLHLLINSLLFKQGITWYALHGNHLKNTSPLS